MSECRNTKALLEGTLSEFYRIGGPNDIADLDIAELWLVRDYTKFRTTPLENLERSLNEITSTIKL